MRLCKRNDRDECDNRKLNNSAYCLSCHKELEETNNYVDSIYWNMLEDHKVLSRENREMLRIVRESVGTVAEMQKDYADASLLVGTSPSGLRDAELSVSVTGASNLSVWTDVTVYGGS